jgi:hypothetical protein
LIPFLSESEINAEAAFELTNGAVFILKNIYGEIYFPYAGVNSIGSASGDTPGALMPGKGYWVYFTQSGVLRFND